MLNLIAALIALGGIYFWIRVFIRNIKSTYRVVEDRTRFSPWLVQKVMKIFGFSFFIDEINQFESSKEAIKYAMDKHYADKRVNMYEIEDMKLMLPHEKEIKE